MTFSLTVAVCTRNRPEQLRRCLRSLCEQKQRLAEIIIVDNAPSDDRSRTIVKEEFPGVRYIEERRVGVDFSRNRALREARYDIIAFIDDDAIADPGWSEQIVLPFLQDATVGVVTGRTIALSLETEAQRLFEANGGYGRGTKRISLPADARARSLYGIRAPLIAWTVSVGNGTNCAFRCDMARTIGGFDEALDLGEALHGGGDLDMFWRMLANGYQLIYEPGALVMHEHRREIPGMTQQLAAHQKALIAFLKKSVSQSHGLHRIIVLAYMLWRLCKPGIRLLKRSVRADPLPAAILWKIWKETLKGTRL